MSTLVSWAFAPAWLTPQEAADLAGYSTDVILELVSEGILDWCEAEGNILIEKRSLREYQEAWLDMRAVQLTQEA